VLAVATFASVRSGSRSARIAEQALKVGLRPVLFPSRPDDAHQRIMWGDRHWADLAGAGAVLEDAGGVIYMAMSLRNVGAGIAVLRGWRARPATDALSPTAAVDQRRSGPGRPDVDEFRLQGRDLYVPAGDTSFWQAAIRDKNDPVRARIVETIAHKQPLTIDILYGDHEGGQRTISRFTVSLPDDETGWICSVVRHWNLDRQDPR